MANKKGKKITRRRRTKGEYLAPVDFYDAAGKCCRFKRQVQIEVPPIDQPTAENIFRDSGITFTLKKNTYLLTPPVRIEPEMDFTQIEEQADEIDTGILDDLWNAREAAAYLKISLTQIYKLVKQKKLKTAKHCFKIHFDPHEVIAYRLGVDY